MSTIDLQARIPDNIHLGDNRQLQRALEHWQPAFLNWWSEMGPSDFNAKDVYLRTAVGVDAQGWASYGYAPCPTTAGVSSWPTSSRAAKSALVTTWARGVARRFPANTAAFSAASS